MAEVSRRRDAGMAGEEGVIYLDHQATTPCDGRVVAMMLPYFTEHFGNPHAVHHEYGRTAQEAVEAARAEVAAAIGAQAEEIIFTSGATEADNLAIKGVMQAPGRRGDHIVTLATEHRAVLDPCRRLERYGCSVTFVPLAGDGLIDPQRLEAAITPGTALVSVMAVNNEIGVVQPLAEIGAICRHHGVLFHTDATQAVGRIALDVEAMKIDLLSLSGHKIYGPKGIGALYLRRRPRLRLTAQIDGGGQERGLRAGTLPVPLCVGLGAACRIASAELADEVLRLKALRDRLLAGLRAAIPGLRVNGDLDRRIPGNLNISFLGIETSGLLAALRRIAVSPGAACSSNSTIPSHVLAALGLDTAIWATVRIGLGRFTSETDIDHAIADLSQAVAHLRHLSPIWEPAPEAEYAVAANSKPEAATADLIP